MNDQIEESLFGDDGESVRVNVDIGLSWLSIGLILISFVGVVALLIYAIFAPKADPNFGQALSSFTSIAFLIVLSDVCRKVVKSAKEGFKVIHEDGSDDWWRGNSEDSE